MASAQIIDGKLIARNERAKIKAQVEELKQKGINPKLCVILVGENPASLSYVAGKEKACSWVNMDSIIMCFKSDITQEQLLAEIDKLNNDDTIHGILVQLPLPKGIDALKVQSAIVPHKDVDGFHPVNVGKLLIGDASGFIPCTPLGVMVMLKETGINLTGKNAVVVGRSNIVGKPMAHLLTAANATVTLCHTKTKDLKAITSNADILVCAAGAPHMIKADMVKPGAVVIDVGISRVDDGSLTGDVDYNNVKEVAGFITPVPGGVGPMTIAMLLKNTLKAAQNG